MSNTDRKKKPFVNTGARRGYAVSVSYKTPEALLPMVKSGKSLVGDRWKNTNGRKKEKIIYHLRNGQPVRLTNIF